LPLLFIISTQRISSSIDAVFLLSPPVGGCCRKTDASRASWHGTKVWPLGHLETRRHAGREDFRSRTQREARRGGWRLAVRKASAHLGGWNRGTKKQLHPVKQGPPQYEGMGPYAPPASVGWTHTVPPAELHLRNRMTWVRRGEPELRP
jgi:hypothetical protein